jgi:hypothetical protein
VSIESTRLISVPLITIPVTLACVHFHPNPVDPCPCFEDAIAIMSVMLGGILSVWREHWSGDGVPRALQYSIFSHGHVVGVLFGIERVVIGMSPLFLPR